MDGRIKQIIYVVNFNIEDSVFPNVSEKHFLLGTINIYNIGYILCVSYTSIKLGEVNTIKSIFP